MSGRSIAAIRVPDGLWESPEMVEALASRDIAQVFRLVQRATQASQSHLGVAMGLSQAQVSEIMSGVRRVTSMPPHALFDCATDIRAAGLSLNLICQQYADNRLLRLINGGARMRCLFLDPAGEAIKAREREEGYPQGFLSSPTLVIERRWAAAGLYPMFEQIFTAMCERGRPL